MAVPGEGDPSRPFDEDLLAVLACPATGASLRYDPAAQALIADEAGLAYSVHEGVPILVAAAPRTTTPRPSRPRGAVRALRARVAPGVDLEAPEAREDPLPIYERLRRIGPVAHVPANGVWIVLGHAEGKLVLKDPRRFSSSPHEPIDVALISADPPRHTRVRQAVGGRFSPEVLDAVTVSTERLAATLLKPELDVVSDFARPLTQAVAAGLMGLDDEDAATMAAATAESYLGPAPHVAQFAAIGRLAPRSRIHRDLLRDAEGVLSPLEVHSFTRLLWVASTTTSERVITSSVQRLLHHEPVRHALKREPRLLAAFVDEVTRLHPPVPLIKRVATEETRIGGVTIPAGAELLVCVPVINRDPEQFDEPDRLRLDRKPGRHLGFGAGPHYCIGAAVGRRTVQAALSTLLREMGAFHGCAPSPPPLRFQPPDRLLIAA